MNFSIIDCPSELLEFFQVNQIEHKPNLTKPNFLNFDKQSNFSNDEVWNMLSYLNPDMPYDDWCKVGMALHEGGYNASLWDSWSASGTKYQQGECYRKWNSFNGSGVSFGTLVHMAKQSGWNYPNETLSQLHNLLIKQRPKPIKDFEFVAVGEITKNLKPISWLINDYIESHTLSLLFGDPASGKSFIAIDMACCIATGHEWHSKPVEQGAVFYIAGEGHNGLGRRFKAWEVHNDIDISNAPLYVARRPAQLYDRDSAMKVIEAVQKLAEDNKVTPKLIVVDTLARNFGGADENSTKDMNQFVYHVDELKDTWKATAMIVHHSGHAEKDRARGSIALKGALDQEFAVKKQSETIVSLVNTKMKDGEKPKDKNFEFITIDLPSEGMMPITSAALVETDKVTKTRGGKKLSPQRQRALEVFRNCIIDFGQKRQVRTDMHPVDCVRIHEFKIALENANIVDSDEAANVKRVIGRIVRNLNDLKVTASYDDFIWLVDDTDGQVWSPYHEGATKS
jgi:hypothetical protein